MLSTWNSNLQEVESKKKILDSYATKLAQKRDALEREQTNLLHALDIFKKSTLLTQQDISNTLSSIVSKALGVVFPEKNLELKLEFVERRNTSECDIYLIEDGRQYDLLDGRGYGVLDIISFSLKVAHTLLCSNDKVLILDEPFRNLGKTKHRLASRMIRELSTELGIQFIIATHVTVLKEHADKAFFVEQIDGVSNISLTS